MGFLEDKSRARVFYRYLSKVYDAINPFIWNEEMRDEAIGWLDVEPGDRVLDVGCGTGFATEGLLRETDDVWALDQSAHQLERAYGKFGKRGSVRFHRGDAERLPFDDDSFDAYWSSGSIEYWPNPVAALAEARRVTKPGRPVLVVGPDYPRSSLFQHLADAIMLFYDEDEADRMFSEAGFEEFEHHIQQRAPGTPRAITTVAYVPEADDGGGDDADAELETAGDGSGSHPGSDGDDDAGSDVDSDGSDPDAGGGDDGDAVEAA